LRARVKRRQRTRRLLYVALIVGVGVLLFGGIYFLSLPSGLDKFDGKQVTASDLSGLVHASKLYTNPGVTLGPGAKMKNATDSFTSNGKPILLYVGEEGCPYCAEMRWPLTIALLRFGNFTALSYMTSSLDGTDFPTFTYHGSSYSSPYLIFKAYELNDRGQVSLDTLPANYTTPFSTYGGNAFPFLDFAGKHYLAGAPIPATPQGYLGPIPYLTDLFGSKNWSQIITSLGSSGVPISPIIMQGANLITAQICKADGNLPAKVCTQGPIVSLEAYSPAFAPALVTGPEVAPAPREGWT
jgi:Domain of unknown function (DUF929)